MTIINRHRRFDTFIRLLSGKTEKGRGIGRNIVKYFSSLSSRVIQRQKEIEKENQHIRTKQEDYIEIVKEGCHARCCYFFPLEKYQTKPPVSNDPVTNPRMKFVRELS